jgi:hypothetical protein
MKLFGGHPDTLDPTTLQPLLEDALKQQPIIVSAFLDQAIAKAEADKDASEVLPALVETSLKALLVHVGTENGSDDGSLAQVRRGVLLGVETILDASATRPPVREAALRAWETSEYSGALLTQYTSFFSPRLAAAKKEGYKGAAAPDEPAQVAAPAAEASAPAPAEAAAQEEGAPAMEAPPATPQAPPPTAPAADGGVAVREDMRRDEAVIQSLAALFIAKPTVWRAFADLVPLVFETHLVLGSAPRVRFNQTLLTGSLDERLGKVRVASAESTPDSLARLHRQFPAWHAMRESTIDPALSLLAHSDHRRVR